MKRTYFLSFCFVLSCTLSQADEQKVTKLPEVVVKGGSSVVPDAESAKNELKKTPGGVAVISKEDYAKGRASTPQDLLGWTPGVHVQQRDTASLESRISIRGSGLQRTFHLRGVNLLQDGIPLNQADGGGDAQRFDPLAVDYTEVYRGGNALRYGATTLGGAINFVSPTGYTADSLQARLEFGSFEYIRSQISSGQVMGPWDYYASVTQFKQEGFRVHTDQDNYSVYTNVGHKFNDSVETRLYATFIKALSKLGGGLTKSQMNTNPEQANATSVSQNRKRDLDYARLASKTTFTNGEQKVDLTGYLSNYELFHPISPVIYQDADDWGGDIRYTDTRELWGHQNEFLLGFGASAGTVDDDRYNNAGGEPVGRAGEFDNEAYNLNLYGEDRFLLADRLTLVAGAQGVYAVREVNDFFRPATGAGAGDDSGEVDYHTVNPKIGLLYDLTEAIQLFFGFNQSYEPPTFSEMTTPAGDFRPNDAQVSRTLEGGVRGSEGIFEWDATYYRSRIKDELLSLNDAAGNALGTINAPSDTVHEGIEFGGGVRLCDNVTARLLYNWNRFVFDGDPLFGDNQLPGFPEHFFKAELLYEHPNGVYFGPNMEQAFEGYPIDMRNTFFADPYVVVGFKAGYRMKKGPSFFFEAKNLTDEVYAASTGVVTNANFLDSAQFNPGTGRSYFGGVEWRW